MAFVTSNIILMPFLGAALTTIIAMMGQMIMYYYRSFRFVGFT